MTRLLSLPSSLSVDILVIWCDILAVKQLDSAVCNRSQRINLINLYEFCTLNINVLQQKWDFWNWIIIRKLKFSSFFVIGCICDNINPSMFQKMNFSKTKQITLSYLKSNEWASTDFILELFKNATNVETLKIHCPNKDFLGPLTKTVQEQLLKQLQALIISIPSTICVQLKTLDLRTEFCPTSTSLDHFASNCVNLLSFTLIATKSLFDSKIIEKLVRRNPKLQIIQLNCKVQSMLTNVSPYSVCTILRAILESCDNIKCISFTHCESFQFSMVSEILLKYATTLQVLSLTTSVVSRPLPQNPSFYYKNVNNYSILKLDNVQLKTDVEWCRAFIKEKQYKMNEIRLFKCSDVLVTSDFIDCISDNNSKGDLTALYIANCGSNYTIDCVRKLFMKHKGTIKDWRVCGNSNFSDMDMVELSCLNR